MIVDTSALIAVLAKATGRKLLYKGSDFSETDIESALD